MTSRRFEHVEAALEFLGALKSSLSLAPTAMADLNKAIEHLRRALEPSHKFLLKYDIVVDADDLAHAIETRDSIGRRLTNWERVLTVDVEGPVLEEDA